MADKSRSVGRKLLSGSVLRVTNLAGAAVASFFLMPFIVHHLGDRIYGFWSFTAVFVGYYNLLDFGLSSAVSQYICIAIGRKDQAECRVVFNTALRLQLLVGGVALFATAVIAAATPWFCYNPADVHVFRKVLIFLGIHAGLGFPREGLLGRLGGTVTIRCSVLAGKSRTGLAHGTDCLGDLGRRWTAGAGVGDAICHAAGNGASGMVCQTRGPVGAN